MGCRKRGVEHVRGGRSLGPLTPNLPTKIIPTLRSLASDLPGKFPTAMRVTPLKTKSMIESSTLAMVHMAIWLYFHFTVISESWTEINHLTIISEYWTIILKLQRIETIIKWQYKISGAIYS